VEQMERYPGPIGERVVTAGRPLSEARAVMILVHGRGASAESILGLAGELDRPAFAYLAPQAAGHTWYPYSFLAPLEQNEPHLSSALALLGSVVDQAAEAGIPPERLMLAGFSQGACLTVEFAARNARRYGGVAALTGGLIGPDGTSRECPGSFHGTPIFLGSSDPDPHVPRSRVEESARVLEGMGARVTTRIYPAMGHTINEDELGHVRALMDDVLEGGTDTEGGRG
jgi:predicted esterase